MRSAISLSIVLALATGESHHLKKGDFIEVPAGMPHWFKDVPASINYYVVKVVKP